eukprot:snap_masked-scaffold_39-processed-gene-1.33-mRNA-1 protein AED:1.00 eAED:1.00 QI:0/0/0/0/1/1/2/0/327
MNIKLSNVFIFDDLTAFLVSMAMLMSKVITLNAKLNTITILKISIVKDKNNLFMLKYRSKQDMNKSKEDSVQNTNFEELLALTKKQVSKVEYLHNLFGHQGKEVFKLTLKYYNYDINEIEINNFNCEVCEINNIKKSIIKKKHPTGFKGKDGEFFVLDSVEVLTTSGAGNSGFVLATDINSKYRFIYCYKRKRDITAELIKFFKWFQLATNIKIKRLYSDQGTGLFNEKTISFCEESGIYYSVSAPGVSEHNGLAERSNQFIMGKIRLLLNATTLNVSLYWDFAAYYAVFLTNRVTEGSSNISAYEKVLSKKPNETKLLIFRCSVIY